MDWQLYALIGGLSWGVHLLTMPLAAAIIGHRMGRCCIRPLAISLPVILLLWPIVLPLTVVPLIWVGLMSRGVDKKGR